MIVSIFMDTIYYLLYAVTSPIRLLPNATLPQGFQDAMTNAGNYITPLNSFIPIDTILSLIYLYVLIEGSYLTYKLIMWLIKRFPTQS